MDTPFFTNPDDIVYRQGVGLMILNLQGKVLVGQRRDTGNLVTDGASAWQMPQGGIDSNETPWEAALREMKEEIGTINVRLIASSHNWLTYDFPEPLRSTLWGGAFLWTNAKMVLAGIFRQRY